MEADLFVGVRTYRYARPWWAAWRERRTVKDEYAIEWDDFGEYEGRWVTANIRLRLDKAGVTEIDYWGVTEDQSLLVGSFPR